MLKRLGEFFLDTIQVVIFAGAIFLFLYLLVMQPHRIKGISMKPNFLDGEYLLTDKVTYRFSDPKRGDVIVFKAPNDSGDDYIKRIIGTPGEKVSLKDGHVYVNGNMLEEKYLPSDFETLPGRYLGADSELTVPNGQLFVLGDNRSHSEDSRAFGFVEKSTIIGRAWVMYWPISKVGLIKRPNY